MNRTEPKRPSGRRREGRVRREEKAPIAVPGSRDELRFQSARMLLELARGTGAEWGTWVRHLCQFEAEVMHVERVSFWRFDEGASSMTCDAGYIARTREFEHGALLLASDLPEYFEAIREARALNLEDVHSDPRVGGLSDYCAARGIGSMLDVPVWSEGRLSGVICHEHVGGRRHWSPEENDFAMNVGQVVASVLAARAQTQDKAASHRAAFLDAVSRAVLSSLDPREIARRAVALVVPSLADAALVWMINGVDVLECLALTHADPQKRQGIVDLVAELARRHVGPDFATRVMRQKQSVFVPEFSRAVLEAHPFSKAEREVFEQQGVTSSIGVPLTITDRTIGAMTLHMEGRHFNQADRALAEDVAERVTAALENARIHGIAAEAIRARDDFLVVVAHELRTPLTALQLMTDDLLRRTRRGADAEETKRSDSIARQVHRFSGIVEHVIDALSTRAEGLKLELDSCDLVPIVKTCAERLAEQARKAGTPITVRTPPSIVGRFDRARVEQVVLALLDNALKFGRGKPIELSLHQEGARAELTVRDHGHGIAPERLPAMFAPFERAAAKEHFGGLGLGLYMARAIAEAHGGSVTARSAVGHGATFVVQLPLSE